MKPLASTPKTKAGAKTASPRCDDAHLDNVDLCGPTAAERPSNDGTSVGREAPPIGQALGEEVSDAPPRCLGGWLGERPTSMVADAGYGGTTSATAGWPREATSEQPCRSSLVCPRGAGEGRERR
jgi:hypothetical protein